MTRFAVLLVLAAACGGGSKSVANTAPTAGSGDIPDPIPHTKGPNCTLVADRLATVAYADAADRQAEARNTFRARCIDDKWSDDVRSCFATVETDDEIHGCASKLDTAQQTKLRSAAPDLAPAPAPTASPAAPASSDPWGGSTGSSGAPGGGGTRGPKRNSSDPCEGGE